MGVKINRLKKIIILCGFSLLLFSGVFWVYHNKFSADSLGGDLAFYKTNLAGENKTKVQSFTVNLPKGETESFVLEIQHSGADSHGSLTTRTNLKQGALAFPEANIDDRVIYNWKQKKIDITRQDRPKFANLDELLVKTNKVDYLDSSITKTSLPTSLGFKSSAQNSNQTDFKFVDNKVKIYFKITAPENSGVYRGRIEVFDKDKGLAIGTVDVQIKVIDKKLPSLNDYTFGCYTNDRIRREGAMMPYYNAQGYFVNEKQYENRLEELRSLGCNALIVRMSEASDNIAMIEAIQKAGFSKGVLIDFRYNNGGSEQKLLTLEEGDLNNIPREQFKNLVRELVSNKDSIRIPVSFYGIDEPNSRNNENPQSYDNYKKQVANIDDLFDQVVGKEFNGDGGTISANVTTAMVSDTYIDLLSEENTLYHTESPILHYFYNCVTHRIDGLDCRPGSVSMEELLTSYKKGTSQMPANAMYYFQSTYEDSSSNRYLGGLALASSGLKGYYLNAVYGFTGSFDYNPPQIFSEDSFPQDVGNRLTNLKQNMMLYPAVDGLIPTVQSESIREGMMDLKYYLAYKEITKNISKCSIVNRPAINNLLWKVEASRKNAPNEFSVSDMYSNGYNLPTKSIEKFRTNLENLFFQFNSRCE